MTSSKRLERQRERRKRESTRFWDRKARLDYYLVSLPFALAGVAIASYGLPSGVGLSLVTLEVISWTALLGSGLVGLRARWGEMEVARLSSVSASGAIHRR